MSVLSKTQFMSAAELGEVISGDFDIPAKHLRTAMRRQWREAGEGIDDAHPSEQIHGGPDNYIEHLKGSIQEEGIRKPIRIKRGKIFDGNHRAIAAIELGMDKIPVQHFKPIKR